MGRGDGINVMFGNPNDRRVETQPYIIIVGRDTLEHLQWEAKRYKKNKDVLGEGESDTNAELESEIQPDSENNLFPGIGGRTEIISDAGHGKALYVYLYSKVTKERDRVDPDTGMTVYEDEVDENGDPVQAKDDKGKPMTDEFGMPVFKKRPVKELVTSVHVTKATRDAIIYENVDTGLEHYPIAWGNWEKQKNQYHGRALVTGVIPNQIFINTMFAMVMRHLQLSGFPKTVYNADLISSWSNEVGQAIGVHGVAPGQGMGQVAANLAPADMSSQIIAAIDKAMAYTKDCLGATDAQMGNVSPENTSALMVLQSSAEIPLENTRAGLYEWLEDIGAILLDMMGNYYGLRPLVRERELHRPRVDALGEPVIDEEAGLIATESFTRRVTELYDFSGFRELWFSVRVNAGASTYFSEIAMVQTLDNLRRDGTLSLVEYLERIPDKLIPRKAELIEAVKERAELAQTGGGGDLSEAGRLSTLPAGIQAKYPTLPRTARNALLSRARMKAR